LRQFISKEPEASQEAQKQEPRKPLSVGELGDMAAAMGPEALQSHLVQLVEGISATNALSQNPEKKANLEVLIRNIAQVIQAMPVAAVGEASAPPQNAPAASLTGHGDLSVFAPATKKQKEDMAA
jgi:hypothetical protein